MSNVYDTIAIKDKVLNDKIRKALQSNINKDLQLKHILNTKCDYSSDFDCALLNRVKEVAEFLSKEMSSKYNRNLEASVTRASQDFLKGSYVIRFYQYKPYCHQLSDMPMFTIGIEVNLVAVDSKFEIEAKCIAFNLCDAMLIETQNKFLNNCKGRLSSTNLFNQQSILNYILGIYSKIFVSKSIRAFMDETQYSY